MQAPTPALKDEVLRALLGLSAADLNLAWLESAELLRDEGLAALLAAARQAMGRRPAEADRLATACRLGAEHLALAPLIPAADYLLAQSRALQGAFGDADGLLDRARRGYEAAGDPAAALRTDLGRINVLHMSGRHEAAVATADALLAALSAGSDSGAAFGHEERWRLTAAVENNRGICLRHLGRLTEALDAFEEAVRHFERLEQPLLLADARINRANALVSLARPGDALPDLQAAVQAFSAAGQEHAHGRAACNLGHALLALGRYEEALAAFGVAADSFERCAAPPLSFGILALDQAEAQLALNLLGEARKGFAEALRLLGDDGPPFERARAHWGLGAVGLRAADLPAALEAVTRARALFDAGGNGPQSLGVCLTEAGILDRSGDGAGALAKAEAALEAAVAARWDTQALLAGLTLADLAIRQDRLSRAEAVLGNAEARIEALGLRTLEAWLWQLQGRLLWRQGHTDAAERRLRSAIEAIEGLRGGLGRLSWRRGFLEDKLAAYETLVELLLTRGGPGDVRAAFQVAEQAKSRTLAENLMGLAGGGGGLAPGAVAADELEELKAELSAVYSSMLGNAGQEGERAMPLPSLQARAVELEAAIDRIVVRDSGAGGDGDLHPAAAAVDPAAIALGETLLAYHIVDERIHAFVVRDGEVAAHADLAALSEVAEALRRLGVQLDRFRMGTDFVARHAAIIQRSTDRALDLLHAMLFRPIEPLLAGDGPPSAVERLTIVPHGLLHQVPFGALRRDGIHLVDAYELVIAPSVTVRALCQQRLRPPSGRSLVFGAADERIPAALEEARQVSELVADATLFQGEAAGLEPLRQGLAAGDVTVLHLACHGLFRADNPHYSALKLADGWLVAREVEGMALNGALVALSACESGRSDIKPGDEILGLSRAFLAAGATTLVVSQWLVHDDSAAAIMVRFYQELRAGRDPAAALRLAQVAHRETRPHPYYWAPFVLIGRR